MRTMTKPALCIIASCMLMFPATISLAQSRPDIGTFDIEKVRKDVGGDSSGISADSPRTSTKPVSAKVPENWTLVLLRITLYLAITIAAIFLLVWVIKRVGLAGRSKMGGGSMDVLEALPLGSNRTIALIRVLDKVYLIGQTQNQITVLDTVEGQKAIEVISSSRGVVSMARFKDVFASFMERFKAK